jgi:transposase
VRLFFPPAACRGCGEGLAGEPAVAQRRHQLTDIEPAPAPRVTEYVAQAKECPCCGTVTEGGLPVHVRARASFGPEASAQAANLTAGHHIPVYRATLLLCQLAGLTVSAGWMAGIRGKAAALIGASGFADRASPMTERFAADIRHYIDARGLDLVRFAKGQSKDEVARRYLAGHDGGEQILFAGVAQEKTRVWRTRQRRDRLTGKRYPWLCQEQAMVNHWYFYGFDAGFGPFYVKFCGYFPYTGQIYLTGTSTPSGSALGPGSASPPWTTRSGRPMTRPRCSRSATG